MFFYFYSFYELRFFRVFCAQYCMQKFADSTNLERVHLCFALILLLAHEICANQIKKNVLCVLLFFCEFKFCFFRHCAKSLFFLWFCGRSYR